MTYDIGCPVLDKMHRSLYDKTIVILNTSTRTRTNRLKAGENLVGSAASIVCHKIFTEWSDLSINT